jgi:hypothetical protein
MPRLSQADCDFARAHITRYYDSDFYPKAFEYQALWASWDRCLDYLTSTDVEALPAHSPRLYAAPKPGGDFRVVHQLDPIATIVYTALAYRLAPFIEAARRPIRDGVACSYRIEVDATRGGFFGENKGYEQFLERCRALARSYQHVLVADISDFYNQVYLHRLQNALRLCHPEAGPYSTAIEDYLISVNGGVSKGLPVGPAASILMAEACLIDVDDMILSKGFALTRYVDDIRVFADSPEDLGRLHQELTVYLYAHHRLSLSGSKTKVVPAAAFAERYIDDPALTETQLAHSRLSNATPAAQGGATASFVAIRHPVGDAPPDPGVVIELMHSLCRAPTLNMGLARHLLRKCRRYRIRAPIPLLLEHFSFFAPVINDVVLYLERVSSPAFVERHSAAIAALYDNAPALRIPFVRHWFDGYAASHLAFLDEEATRRAVQNSPSFSAQARCARTLHDVAWIRSRKQDIDALSSSERREVFRSSVILAREERNAWLRRIARNQSYIVDQLVIEWVLSQ